MTVPKEQNLNLRFLLFKNTGFQMAAYVLTTGIGLLTTAVLSRYLGVDGFGEYSYIFAFYFIFLTLNDFGINTIVVREVSKAPDRAGEMIGSVLILKLLLSCALTGAAAIVIQRMNFSARLTDALTIYSLILVLLALQLPNVMFQVALRMEYPSVLNIVNKALQFLLILAVVGAGLGLKAVVAALLVSEIVMLPALYFFVRRFTRLHFRVDGGLWKSVLGASIPIGITTLAGLFTNYINFLFLERMTDLREVGMYSAAHRVTTVFQIFASMLMMTVYPVMSRFACSDIGRLGRLYRKCLLAFGGSGIAMALAVTFAAPWIIRGLFGTEFAGAETGLQVLIWAIAMMYFAICGGNLLISLNHEKINLAILTVSGCVNVGLNFLWIPRYGFVGAAWATVAAFAVITSATLIASSYFLQKAKEQKGSDPFRNDRNEGR